MKIHHTALYVRNLEAVKGFFVRYFGAVSNKEYHNVKTGFRSYFLGFEDGAKLEIMTREHLTDKADDGIAHSGYHHVSFAVGGRDDVDRLTQELRHVGYEVLDGPRTTGDGHYESCIAGIENIRVELTDARA